jgi:hypothetical protein
MKCLDILLYNIDLLSYLGLDTSKKLKENRVRRIQLTEKSSLFSVPIAHSRELRSHFLHREMWGIMG